MISRLITLATAVAVMITVICGLYFWQTGGLPFVTRPSPTQIVAERQQALRHDISEADVSCLAQEMWHGAGKGTGDKLEHMLIGVAAINYRGVTNKALCVIFSQGLIMMPEHRKYTRSSIVVTPESKAGTTSSQTSKMAEELAREMLQKEKNKVKQLPPEYVAYECVFKFVRNYDGLLWMVIGPKALVKLRTELEKELGAPVYQHPSGSVFFCPKK